MTPAVIITASCTMARLIRRWMTPPAALAHLLLVSPAATSSRSLVTALLFTAFCIMARPTRRWMTPLQVSQNPPRLHFSALAWQPWADIAGSGGNWGQLNLPIAGEKGIRRGEHG